MVFNICMDGVRRETKAKVGEVGVKLHIKDGEWAFKTILFMDDTVLFAVSEQ